MLRIRFYRTGKKHQPNYRIVVAERTAAVGGKFISILGSYNPFTKKIVLKKEEAIKWMNDGAQPSNSVSKLFKKEGIKHKLIVIKQFKAKPKSEKTETQPEVKKEVKQEEKENVDSHDETEAKEVTKEPIQEDASLDAKPSNLDQPMTESTEEKTEEAPQ